MSTLSAEQAIEIYRMMPLHFDNRENIKDDTVISSKARGGSAPIARKYGVSAKAIRDIWNRRTWAFATLEIWKEKQFGFLSIEAKGPSTVRVRIRAIMLSFI